MIYPQSELKHVILFCTFFWGEHTQRAMYIISESIAHCDRNNSHRGIPHFRSFNEASVKAFCKQTRVDFECFTFDNFNDTPDDDVDSLFEVFGNHAFVRCRSQDDCLNSFSRSNLFEPSMHSERARYNFQTGLTDTRNALIRTKAAASRPQQLRFSTSTQYK